jgi:beta-lactamase class A
MARTASSRSTRPRSLAAGLLGVAATLGLAACGHPASVAPKPSSSPATATQPASPQVIGLSAASAVGAALPAELTAYIKSIGGHAGIAVIDRTTGLTVEANADATFQTASIVKFDILATRLYQHQQAGTSMTSHEKSLAFSMITESDNDAATALYRLDGQASGMAEANEAFGLKVTVPNAAWGETHTTPADQLRLLSAVMDPNGPISDASRQYILSLMSKVDPQQRWGITAAAGPDATNVYVKNGWDTIDQYGGMRGDNSIGRIIEPGHDWLIAVMSDYNRSDGAGHTIDGTLSTMAVDGLRLESDLAGGTTTSGN